MSVLGSLSMISPEATTEELVDHVTMLTKTVEYQLSGRLDTHNIREIGGWYVNDKMLVSKNMSVGFSSATDRMENIRIFAGNAAVENAPFRVYDSGRFVATNASITGSIYMTGGTIEWTGVGAPAYSQITGTKPPTNADNTNEMLATGLGPYYTKIGNTYIYTGTLTASQINAVNGITLGANATIDWFQVTAPNYSQIGGTKPPTNADNTYANIAGALGPNYRYTSIGSTFVYTGTVDAYQINTTNLAAEKIYQAGQASNYAVMGGSYGDMILHYQGNPYFTIFNGIDYMDFKHMNTTRLRFSAAANQARPMGNWDFGSATVSGVNAKAVFG